MDVPPKTTDAAASVLIVEDEVPQAKALRAGLTEAGFRVQHAATLAAATSAFAGTAPDLVLLDLGLPDGDGLEWLGHLRRTHPALPVVITTARSTPRQRVAGLSHGADDYLAKPYDFGELVARIRIQLRHARRLEPRLVVADLVIDRNTRSVTRGGETLLLTPREYDILIYLLGLNGAVASRDMLARHVWQINSRMTSLDNVIDVTMSRLRGKMDRDRAQPLIETVRGVGFALRVPA